MTIEIGDNPPLSPWRRAPSKREEQPPVPPGDTDPTISARTA
ncbi:hypothetical protein ACFLYR_07190 [Chloroflexota bacterium]